MPKGARVGLVGPNGAGTSTLLRMVAGQIEPDTGLIALPRETPRARLTATIRSGLDTSERFVGCQFELSNSVSVKLRMRSRRHDLGTARIWKASATDCSDGPFSVASIIAVPARPARSRFVVSGTTKTD